MRAARAASGLVVLFVLVGSAEASPEAYDSVKAYRGQNGELVQVVALRPASANKALVRVRYADSNHDGLVLPCDVEREEREVRFITRYNGGQWTILLRTGDAHDAFVPGSPSFRVRYDQAATDAARADDIFSARDAQAADGRLKLFQRKSYPHIEAKYEGLARDAASGLTKSCGRAVSMRFDWTTFEDEVMAEVDAWKACAPIVAHLQRSCVLLAGADRIVCRMGQAYAVKVEGSSLVFTTTPKGKDGAAEFLRAQKR